MGVVDASFGQPMKEEESAAIPFAGGLLQHGYQCGMLWGAALAAGAQAYRIFGAGPQAETAAVLAAEKQVAAFQKRAHHIHCADIIEMQWQAVSQPGFGRQVLKFFLKGGPLLCFRLAAQYAPAAREAIERVYSDPDLNCAPQTPASCASMVARKMGASDQHVVMAAGFAGGIGLSGGACGALGAAIWLRSLKRTPSERGPVEMADPEAQRVFEAFLTYSDYAIECQEIVGRKFEQVGDHAAYLRAGGCARIIEGLGTLD